MQKTKIPATPQMALVFSQHRLAIALKFSVITLAVVALYFQDLSLVFTGALTDESTYHILAIPFLFAYLIYRKRKMINAAFQHPQTITFGLQKYFSTLAGMSLFAVSILAYWYGSYTFTPLEYHMLTLPFLVAGLILILFNTQILKQLFFPVAFLIFLTPPPDEILYGIGSSLANLSASASNALANIFGLHTTLSVSNVGPVITLIRPDHAALPFNVDVACSGIYSLIGFVIFALFIAYITRGKMRNKFLIFAMGIPLIVALNILRITAILAVGYNFGENLALQLFHDVGAPVLMFIGTLLLLAVTERVFKNPKPPQPCPTYTPTVASSSELFCPTCGKLFKLPKINLNRADVAKIAGIAIIILVLLSIQAPVFVLTQGPAQVMNQTPLGVQVNNTSNFVLPNFPGYNLSYLYRDPQFEQESGDDAALVYSYAPSNGSALTVWVAIQISSSVVSEHRWETCLVNYPISQGNPLTVNQLDLRDIQIQDNPPLTARYFAFQNNDTNQTQVVLYWYETATFDTNSSSQTKSVMISLIIYPLSPQTISQAEAQELPFANAINNFWKPIQTWSAFTLSISQNGFVLAAAATAILVFLILCEIYLGRKEKLALLNLYRKLSPQDQLVMKAVNNAQNIHNPTTQGVTLELQKLLAQPTASESWVAEKLAEAESAGLIKKILVNMDDTPAFAWKNQMPQNSL